MDGLELLKGLQVGVAVTFAVRVALYARAVGEAFRDRPREEASLFLVSVYGEWVCNAVLFVPLALLFGLGETRPVSLPGFPMPLRLGYHVGYLTFGAFLFALKRRHGERFWPRFLLWSAGIATLVAFVYVSPWV